MKIILKIDVIRSIYKLSIIGFSCFYWNCSYETKENINKNKSPLAHYYGLAKLHTELGKPEPGDWLLSYNEKGQAYQDYCNKKPVCPSDSLNKIYILPLGTFSEIERKLLNEVADYVRIFFTMDVKLLEPVSDSVVPEKARRLWFVGEQLNTRYIFDHILLKNMPKDAYAYISITNKDLFPSENWNYVFGEANLVKRVGVSSYCRYTDDKLNSSNYTECFVRSIKTTTHELCHMFSIKHCAIYYCLINGANNLDEADRKPLWLCPECLAKLQWCIKFDLIKRYDRLIEYFENHKFKKEVKFFKESKEIMSRK